MAQKLKSIEWGVVWQWDAMGWKNVVFICFYTLHLGQRECGVHVPIVWGFTWLEPCFRNGDC